MADTKAFLANVMDAYVYSGENLVFTSKALTDSSISIAVTAEEVRGGKSNKLIGRFFHDSSFSMELQDALFNLNYIAMNVGQEINHAGTLGGLLREESIVCATTGNLTVTGGTPQAFMGQGDVIGWIAEPDSDSWTKFTFTAGAKTATGVKVGTQDIQSGNTYCVKYFEGVTFDEVTIPGDIIPSEVTVVLKGDLYRASKGNDVGSSSVIGQIEIEIPRFQLNGSMDLALNSSGAAQVPFSGSALLTADGTSCASGGYYAKVKEFKSTANWYDKLIGMALEGQDSITVTTGVNFPLRTYGVFSDGTSRLIDPALLSYTAVGCTVNESGVITAITQAGTVTIAPKTGTSTVRLVVNTAIAS